jgi:Protein of unknown function (DUF2855)
MTLTQFQVRKDDLSQTRLVTLEEEPLQEGQVRVRIDHFAYTANNITYAAFGDAMNYWQFFPVPGDEPGWGIVPVWGFAQVTQSAHEQVPVGERLYGYWPMATHAVLQPTRVTPAGWTDGAAHRAGLHAVYNLYSRCAADPFYTPDSEALQALLRPLFMTAWLIDDFLADNAWFGASEGGARPRLLLSSASSKTAYATAALLSQRAEVEVIGLTSARNRAFCESLGVYARVLAYEQLDALDEQAPCLYVDFAGNGRLRKAIHTRFSRLAYSCSIGGTHVDQLGGSRDLPGPRPVLFFAPAQVKKRAAEWGGAELNRRLVTAWQRFRTQAGSGTPPWLQVQTRTGPDAVAAVHAEVLSGQGDPRTGQILSLWPAMSSAA